MTLIVTDTYNEEEVSKSIEKIGKDICSIIAIQLAIVGLGNKNYGIVKYNDNEINIKNFFDKNKIIYDANLGTQLDPSALTPRRLVRFFRFIIKDFIEHTGQCSYLFRKYCPNQNLSYSNVIFPGFEHIAIPDKDEDNVILLVQTYMILDKRQQPNSMISERIKRVLLARGFNINFLNSIVINH